MLKAIPLWLVVARALSAPVAAPDPAQPHAIVQTVRTDSSGKQTEETRTADPDASTALVVQPDGQVHETVSRSEARVLIELRERPTHDRHKPGSRGEAGRQRAALARDLAGIDQKLKTHKKTKIKRHFETLFSGVAATVDRAAVTEIRRLPYVLAVHDDVEVRAQLADSVPMIGATSVAATYGVDGTGVTIAVIDTGIDYTHPDLGGCFGAACRVKGGYDFVNDDADPSDDHGHGTHVAGILAANGIVRGVAPGATLLAYKVLHQNGYGDSSDIIAAVEQAVLAGAKIANISIGGPGNPGDPTSQAIDNATAAGMLSVVAAGNNGPSYQTITSPGVARTALTVGAVTKSGEMASFSSRGYVSDGSSYAMKPEITAPGVSIRSTLPATGTMGDPTGYGVADGTSMATPHVAGAAALLLHWNAAQTPADLKQRLVASATPLGAGTFAEGAGMVNLVRAFALRVLSSVTHVPLGVAAGTSGIVQFEQTISIRNPASAAQTVSLGAGSPALPAGATLTVLPTSLTLQAGESAAVTVRVQVDKAVTPEAPYPLAWSTRVAVTAGGETANVPVYFFRASVLDLTFDEAPAAVYLASPDRLILRTIERPGASLSTVLEAGQWDVVVFYDGLPVTYVVREQVNVQGQLAVSLERSEAKREVTVRLIGDAEQPLRGNGESASRLYLGLRRTTAADTLDMLFSYESRQGGFLVSPLSARWVVGTIGGGPDQEGKKFFSYSWAGAGLTSDVILPVLGAPMRQLSQAAAPLPGTASTTLVHVLGFTARFTGQMGFGMQTGAAPPGELDWTMYFQWTDTPGLPMLMVQAPLLYGKDLNGTETDTVDGTYLRHTGGADMVADQSPFFDVFERFRQPDAVLGPAVKRWDLDTAPSSLPLKFTNGSSTLYAYGRTPPVWLTQTASRRRRAGGTEPKFTLYRAGVLAGTHYLSELGYTLPTTAGLHELHATTPHRIAGISGASSAVITFDTTRNDPNPPWVQHFRVEQNGQRTATPVAPPAAGTSVRFEVHDDVSVAAVTLEWRQHGASGWTSLPFSISGEEYVAPLALQGAIDLRLTVRDSEGNRFQERWIPAVVTSAAVPPAAPASVTASRSGGAISISWAPSSSVAGIAHYRVQRLPGGHSFETSGPVTTFLDNNGVVSGNAYFYRVVAVDENGLESAPSGYDGASLISFQEDPLVAGTRIRGVHVGELRLAVDELRNAAGLPPVWTNYGAATGVVRAADFLELRDGLNAARSVVGLPAVQLSPTAGPGARIRASHVTQLRDAVK